MDEGVLEIGGDAGPSGDIILRFHGNETRVAIQENTKNLTLLQPLDKEVHSHHYFSEMLLFLVLASKDSLNFFWTRLVIQVLSQGVVGPSHITTNLTCERLGNHNEPVS